MLLWKPLDRTKRDFHHCTIDRKGRRWLLNLEHNWRVRLLLRVRQKMRSDPVRLFHALCSRARHKSGTLCFVLCANHCTSHSGRCFVDAFDDCLCKRHVRQHQRPRMHFAHNYFHYYTHCLRLLSHSCNLRIDCWKNESEGENER